MMAITVDEALARLSTNDPLEVWFEREPNNGVSYCTTVERKGVAELLTTTTPMEAGARAQARDMGLIVHFRHKVHGIGFLYIQTRPECRLSLEQLADSLKRGSGTNLFSRSA